MLGKGRPENYLCPVSIATLDGRDVEWLDKGLKLDYHETRLETVLDKVLQGDVALWRLGDYDGVVLTEIIVRGDRQVVWVSHLSGRNVVRNLDRIVDGLKNYAKRIGAGSVETAPDNPKLERLFMKKFRKLATIFTVEVL